MISYLIDGAIFAALAAIGAALFMAWRELKRLRGHHEHYRFVLDETAAAATAVDAAVRDLNSHGAQILLALGERIGDGHKVISEIDERMDAVAEHYEAERKAASNVLQFAAVAGNAAMRRAEERYDRRAAGQQDADEGYEDDPRPQRPMQRLPAEERRPAERRPAQTETPVRWPTLGDRFNAWRESDEQEQRKAPRGRLVR